MLERLKKKQFFWNAAGQLGRFYPKSQFRKIPGQILIEPTNLCNLRCPVCPTYFAMQRARGFMDFALYKSVIDEFKDLAKKPAIGMIFAGEPLLHPRIAEFVEYAAKNGHETLIGTNATLATKDLSEKLIRAGLSNIHLCLEGLTKEAHEVYRQGSKFEVVKKNIEDFISLKKELKSQTPVVVIQTLLTSFSESQLDDMAKWAKETGADAINFKTLSLGSHTSDEMKKRYEYLLPKKGELRRRTSGLTRTLCSAPLRSAVVYWDGELSLCCVDMDNKVKLGNIKNGGFLKTFFSAEAVSKRKLGFRKKFDLCARCSMGDADSLGINIDF